MPSWTLNSARHTPVKPAGTVLTPRQDTLIRNTAGRCFDTESGVSPSHEWKCASTARDTFHTRAREALGLVASKTTKNVRNHGPWHQIKENHLQGASGRSPPPRVWRKQPKRLRVPFSTLKSIVNIPDTRKPVLNPETSWNPRHTCCSRGSKKMS